jgi:hypothetical protein
MLRGRALSGAALVVALWAWPAAAQKTIGGACSGTQAVSTQPTDGNNVVCISSAWEYPAYHGWTNSTSTGVAVQGDATGAGNTGYAGYFDNTDTGNDANYGVYASDASVSGYAGYFINNYNSATAGTAVGVYGQAINNNGSGGWGVYGVGPSANYGGGVYGTTASDFGTAVEGYNTYTGGSGLVYGVYGRIDTAGTGYGVYGLITGNNDAGYGMAALNWGLNNTGYAVYGLNNANGNGNGKVNWGGYFETTTTAAGYGVEGVESGAANTGYGGYFANTATTNNYGVAATTASTGTGYGIYASITGQGNTGYAGYFTNSSTSSGWALNATGTSYFNGNIEIGTTTPVGLLTVNGDIDLAASKYLNFGATDGTSGYGIRDNGGIMEAKNSGGTWGPIATVFAGNTNGATLAAGNTIYCAPQAAVCTGTAPSAAAGNASLALIPHAGIVRNLYWLSGAASGSGKTDTVTVLKNGSATALTCSMANAASCNDTTHSFTVAAGDYLSMQIVIAGGAATTQHSWAIDYSH